MKDKLTTLNDKISIRQAMIIFMLALGAPSLRVVPNYVARFAGNVGWVSAIINIVPAIILVIILSALFKRNKGSLYDIYEKIFGKILNKVLTVVYILWTLFLAALYLRMFGERFLSSILFNANLTAIIIFMALFVFFIVNQKIDVLGRMSEILIYFFVAIICGVFLLVLPQIKLENIWPVTYYDIVPILKGGVPLAALSCYISSIMFLGDKISDVNNLQKNGIKTIIFLGIFAVILILSTIGLFGYRFNAEFLFPYFATLKNIDILNTIERVESLFISTWLASDAVIISLLSFISLNLIKKFFNTKSHKVFSPFFIILIVIIAINLSDNAYSIEKFTRNYGVWINLILFYAIPVIALIVGKIRSRLNF